MINPYSPSSKVDNSSVLPLRGLCRSTATFTEFDVRNMTLYTWLLVAEEDSAGLDELAESILKFDLTNNRDWAIRVTRSYLQRARSGRTIISIRGPTDAANTIRPRFPRVRKMKRRSPTRQICNAQLLERPGFAAFFESSQSSVTRTHKIAESSSQKISHSKYSFSSSRAKSWRDSGNGCLTAKWISDRFSFLRF